MSVQTHLSKTAEKHNHYFFKTWVAAQGQATAQKMPRHPPFKELLLIRNNVIIMMHNIIMLENRGFKRIPGLILAWDKVP